MRKVLKLLLEHRKITFAFIIVIILVILHGRLLFLQSTSSNQLQLTEVKRQDIKVIVSTSGIFTGKDTASLHFKSSGKLAYINAKIGDQVFSGQVLAGLDTQELAIQLQQANNTLRDKQATLDKVLDDIHLFQYGNGGFSAVGSADETATQKQLRTTAEVARDNAYDSIKATQVAFQDTVLVSPISGIITKANFFPGQVIGATDTIEVVDFSQAIFEADIDESDIVKISLGQKAEVILNAYGDKVFQGAITEIIPQTRTTSNGATVITVKITLSDQSIRKIAGLNGQVNVILEEGKNVLTIPQEALREDNTVLVQTPQGINPVKVTPGLRSDTDVEIKEGLKEGERVITNPPTGNQFGRSSNPLNGILRSFRPGRG